MLVSPNDMFYTHDGEVISQPNVHFDSKIKIITLEPEDFTTLYLAGITPQKLILVSNEAMKDISILQQISYISLILKFNMIDDTGFLFFKDMVPSTHNKLKLYFDDNYLVLPAYIRKSGKVSLYNNYLEDYDKDNYPLIKLSSFLLVGLFVFDTILTNNIYLLIKNYNNIIKRQLNNYVRRKFYEEYIKDAFL